MLKHIHDLLATHPFFEGIDDATLELISGCGKNVHFAEGEHIARAGDEARTFYAIRQGRVAVQFEAPGRGPVTVATLEAGDVFGWSWLFPPHEWFYDVVAVEPSRAVEFDGACLRTKCEQDTAIGFDLMKRFAAVFSRRLMASQMQVLDVYGSAPRP